MLRQGITKAQVGQLSELFPGTFLLILNLKYSKLSLPQMYALCKDSLPTDVEFMLYDSLEVGLFISQSLAPPSHVASRLSVQNWSCSRHSKRQSLLWTKCLPLRSIQPVVCDSVDPSIELASNHTWIVVTGDDSGDDSGDEGPGRGRGDEEDMEDAASPVSELTEITQLLLKNHFVRLMRGRLPPRQSCSKARRRTWDPPKKPRQNSRGNLRK